MDGILHPTINMIVKSISIKKPQKQAITLIVTWALAKQIGIGWELEFTEKPDIISAKVMVFVSNNH